MILLLFPSFLNVFLNCVSQMYFPAVFLNCELLGQCCMFVCTQRDRGGTIPVFLNQYFSIVFPNCISELNFRTVFLCLDNVVCLYAHKETEGGPLQT